MGTLANRGEARDLTHAYIKILTLDYLMEDLSVNLGRPQVASLLTCK